MNYNQKNKEKHNDSQFHFKIYDFLPKPRPLITSQLLPHRPIQIYSFPFIPLQIQENASKQSLAFQTPQLQLFKFKQNIDQQFSQKSLAYCKHPYTKPSLPFIHLINKEQQQQEITQSAIFSNFQSGNIDMAKIESNKIKLLISKDTNSKGYTQWFFFGLKGKAGQRVQINICNFGKASSLYQKGMRVLVGQNGIFKRGPSGIYYKNKMKGNGKEFYSLQFTYTFKSTTTTYFTYHYPYSYTRLQQLILRLISQSLPISRRLLTYTLAGNRLDILVITDTNTTHQHKKLIYIMARVHSGQTVGSFLMEAILIFLTGSSDWAIALRKNFIFKIIPMMNPDGVIHGNYRCSLSGCDLNRKWKNPNMKLHPQVYYAKKNILQSNENRKISAVIDLHGHSKKKNAFMYGCIQKKSNRQAQQLPYLLSKIDTNFSFQDSNFTLQKYKEGTARVTLWRTLKINTVYTLETSFCSRQQSHYHYSIKNLNNLGINLCKTIFIYFYSGNELQSEQIQKKLHQKNAFLNELKLNHTLLFKPDNGSETQPSLDKISQTYIQELISKKQKPPLNLKKYQKSPNRLNVSQSLPKKSSQTKCIFQSCLTTNQTHNTHLDLSRTLARGIYFFNEKQLQDLRQRRKRKKKQALSYKQSMFQQRDQSREILPYKVVVPYFSKNQKQRFKIGQRKIYSVNRKVLQQCKGQKRCRYYKKIERKGVFSLDRSNIKISDLILK